MQLFEVAEAVKTLVKDLSMEKVGIEYVEKYMEILNTVNIALDDNHWGREEVRKRCMTRFTDVVDDYAACLYPDISFYLSENCSPDFVYIDYDENTIVIEIPYFNERPVFHFRILSDEVLNQFAKIIEEELEKYFEECNIADKKRDDEEKEKRRQLYNKLRGEFEND